MQEECEEKLKVLISEMKKGDCGNQGGREGDE